MKSQDQISRGRLLTREKDVAARLRRTQSEGGIPDILRVQAQESKATQTLGPETVGSSTQDRATQTGGSDHEEIRHQYETSDERVQRRIQDLQKQHPPISRIRTESKVTQTSGLETEEPSTQDRATQTLTPVQLGQSIVKDLKIRHAEMQSIATQTEVNPDRDATFEKLARERRMNETLERFARDIKQAQERTQRSQSLPPDFRRSETRTQATQTEDAQSKLRNFMKEHRSFIPERGLVYVEQKIRSIEEKRSIRQTIMVRPESSKLA